jgi:putative endonuclease
VKDGFVYIVSNKKRTTLYIGVTSNIENRIFEHKTGKGGVFSSKYKLTDLLYFECVQGMDDAILREKQMKKWNRDWKLRLIKEENPELEDLAADWFDGDL